MVEYLRKKLLLTSKTAGSCTYYTHKIITHLIFYKTIVFLQQFKLQGDKKQIFKKPNIFYMNRLIYICM
jgi:hypothetical protein